MTGRHHIANDMQIKQEIYPRLKQLCEEFSIPANRIHILLGDPAQTIEHFVREHDVDLLALSATGGAKNGTLVNLIDKLLGACECDMQVMR